MIGNPGTNPNAKIVFFGGSEFSLPSLEASAGLATDLLVVTHAPTRVGRAQALTPSPVAARAKALGVQVLEVANLREQSLRDRLNAFEAKVGVCASFGMIFRADFLKLFPMGIINVHPSVLPRHRGPSPVQWTIREGDAETGATLFLIDELVDHGPIIAQERVPVPSEVSTPELMQSLAALGGELLRQTLPRYLNGEISPVPQDHAAATTTPMLTRDSGKINWKTDDAAKIDRMIRALSPWPGVWFSIVSPERSRRDIVEAPSEKRVKILAAMIRSQHSHILQNVRMLPGTFFVQENVLGVQTIRGVLLPSILQLEGGKPLSSAEFLRGHPWITSVEICVT